MKLKIKKPQETRINSMIGGAVKDIIDELKISDLNFGYAPKLGVDGIIQGWEPNTKAIKRETREFYIGKTKVQVEGVLYGVGEPDSNEKYQQTYFHPTVISSEEHAKNPEKLIENTILTIISGYEFMIGCQSWQMPVRVASYIANSASVPESIKGYVGYQYAENLWTNDTLKFSRGQFIMYLKSELQMWQTLLKLVRGEEINEAITFDTSAVDPWRENETPVGLITDIKEPQKNKLNFAGHMSGSLNRNKPISVFGTKEKINTAGKEGIKLKK